MESFDDYYRRHPELNTTNQGSEVWERSKERDSVIYRAALEWVKTQDNPPCGEANFLGCDMQDAIDKELEVSVGWKRVINVG